ncbi:hypothetical protein L599_003000000050 [Luteimonas sp. J16]|nr:hypothetical protein [Luteimonas sp. J16]TWG90525.1 hypothetical protein L599_003000000050 [Luteimonas sp. J16]
MTAPRHDDERIAQQRKRAVRTAVVAGAIALAVYVAFILSGVVGR